MKNTNKILIINLKNYLEVSGDSLFEFLKEAEKVSKKTDTTIYISPPQASIHLIAKHSSLGIIAQHIDLNDPGPSTGYCVPEVLKKIGAIGSIINHSEHILKFDEIHKSVDRLKSLELLSIVCVKSINEIKLIKEFEPNYIAIEPPELIGTKNSIATVKPHLIKDAHKEISDIKNMKDRLICGAGINNADDIRIAYQLGASGILVASSVVKAKNWYDKIFELASVT